MVRIFDSFCITRLLGDTPRSKKNINKTLKRLFLLDTRLFLSICVCLYCIDEIKTFETYLRCRETV